MKPESITFWQEVDVFDRREYPRDWQRLAEQDPHYEAWHDDRQSDDQQAYEDWLESEEGIDYINFKAYEATHSNEGQGYSFA